MTDSSHRICILGGGFGGLYTALRLSELPWDHAEKPEIVLIDQRDRFLFSPLLYELITGELQTWEIAPPFAELLANTDIRFRQGTVRSIDLEQQQVHLTDGETFDYARLVLALGGETPMDMAPGAADHAIPFRTVEDAYHLEEKLRPLEASNAEKIRVAIAGGGYSGVELACKLAERLGDRGRVRLVELSDQILRTSPDFNRKAAQQALDERGIWVDLETRITNITQDTISLDYQGKVDILPVDIVLWTVGTQVPEVVQNLPIAHNPRGQVTVSTHLQVPDHPELFALGDLAECHDASGQKVPATAQAAFQQADYAAWNLWATMTHRPLLPFRYQALGEMMTLGLDNATFTGLGISLEGQLAHVVRRMAYLYRLPTMEHQIRVGLNWMLQPLRSLLSISD